MNHVRDGLTVPFITPSQIAKRALRLVSEVRPAGAFRLRMEGVFAQSELALPSLDVFAERNIAPMIAAAVESSEPPTPDVMLIPAGVDFSARERRVDMWALLVGRLADTGIYSVTIDIKRAP
jgi:hypothetical protein